MTRQAKVWQLFHLRVCLQQVIKILLVMQCSILLVFLKCFFPNSVCSCCQQTYQTYKDIPSTDNVPELNKSRRTPVSSSFVTSCLISGIRFCSLVESDIPPLSSAFVKGVGRPTFKDICRKTFNCGFHCSCQVCIHVMHLVASDFPCRFCLNEAGFSIKCIKN